MSYNFPQTKRSGVNDIQWHLLDDGVGKLGKASGIKIEYSMSDEIDFAQKLSIAQRKELMRELLQSENESFQKELNRIGRLYSHDSVCLEVRKCARDEIEGKPKILNSAQVSHLGNLFRVFEN
ncbi:uncharacterized protein ACRADG_010522 [Cochliomyia hominivorax]